MQAVLDKAQQSLQVNNTISDNILAKLAADCELKEHGVRECISLSIHSLPAASSTSRLCAVSQPSSPVVRVATCEAACAPGLKCSYRVNSVVMDEERGLGVYSHEEDGQAMILFDQHPKDATSPLVRCSYARLVTVEDFRSFKQQHVTEEQVEEDAGENVANKDYNIRGKKCNIEYVGRVIKIEKSGTFDVGRTGVVSAEVGVGSDRVLRVRFDDAGYEGGLVGVNLKHNAVSVIKDPPPIALRCAAFRPPHSFILQPYVQHIHSMFCYLCAAWNRSCHSCSIGLTTSSRIHS